MAVKRLLAAWILVLFSAAQDALSHQSSVPWKNPEDANNGQRSHIQKDNDSDLHDNSNQLARTKVRLSDDQDGHLAADLLLEHLFPLSRAEQDNSKDYPQYLAAQVESANSNRFSFDAPMYGDFFSANAQGPGGINAGLSNAPSLNRSSSGAVIWQPPVLLERTEAIPANTGDVENLLAVIPLSAFEESNSKHEIYDLDNLRFPETDSPMQGYDLPWLPYVTDDNQQKLWYHDLYNAGHSVNDDSYKSVSMNEDKDKRKFDSISGISSFGGLGKRADKRKFDSISGSSSFGRFGKRQDKRKFDSISGSSSFGRFGKRQDKRKFDSISASSSFGRFGKRQDKRKFDSISGSSSFGRFGKRQDKRKFDSISDSSFGGFGKRSHKRKFDSISDSSFGGFGKRQDKRTFDPISELRPLERMSKRSAYEKEISDSNFKEESGVGQKRKFDSISGVSSFGNLGKRQMSDKETFLPTSSVSSYGAADKRLGEDKRRFDSISGTSSFGRFGKRQTQANRQLDTIPDGAPFDNSDKRTFDSISGFSSFGGLGKRQLQQKEI
ncbi:hypothetical protein BsWGS_26675 [Bradybaena similaris]